MRTHYTSSRSGIWAQCILALVFMASLVALRPATVQAKDCSYFCDYIKIYNSTKFETKIIFELCYKDDIKQSESYLVPAGDDVGYGFAPYTIIGYYFSEPVPADVCVYWDPFECYMKIYYCD